MLTRAAILWAVFTAVMGFALGGSFVWSLQFPYTMIEQERANSKKSGAQDHAIHEGEKAEEALARYTWWLTLFTGILAIATVGMGAATLGLYFAGERQIKLTREIFVANQRPWIKASVDIAGDFQSNGETGVVQLAISMENVGSTPALCVHPFIMTYPNVGGGSLLDAYGKLAETFRRQPINTSGYGLTLFPKEPLIRLEHGGTAAIWHKNNIDMGAARGGLDQQGLSICVLIDYISVVGDKHYQTGFIFFLMKEIETGSWTSFELDESYVARGKLLLARHPLGMRIS